MQITENQIEDLALSELQNLAWEYTHGSVLSPGGEQEERHYTEVVLKERLQEAVATINPDIPQEAREEAIRKVLRTESPDLQQNNYRFHKLLTEGVEIEYRKNGSITGDKVWLVDYENPANNEFLAVNQLTIVEDNQTKRPDVILFVNGLPLVVMELKNAANEDADINTAYNQLQTYKQALPSLFTYNALMVASDGWEAIYGSLTASKQFFFNWKTTDGKEVVSEEVPQMETLLKGLFNPGTMLDVIRHFTLFHQNKSDFTKIIPQYHQYYAVNKAIESTKKATSEEGDQRAGVVWHTQGSGKSLSMVFYAGKLILSLNNPTIVVLTDRNDLDDQLFDTFTSSSDLLRQTPVQAESRDKLKKLLSVSSGGIVFTTIQKFLPEKSGQAYPKLSDRSNIVVIADEAHRSQYDFIDGFARHMRDALPKASFIGFTGTPIEKEDKNTQAVFGDYIDVYDIQQAVEDGSTVKIYYESRLAKIRLPEDKKYQVDQRLSEVAEEMEDYGEKQEGVSERLEKIKNKWSRLEAIVGNDQRIQTVAKDLVEHFEQRTKVLEGKGMVVCMSRRICVDLYNEIVKLRPDWHNDEDDKGAIKVVMTGSSSDPVYWQQHVRTKARRKALGERLKDPDDELKLVLVRDMWLTGFDAPPLHTLYVDKPMKGHTLMQAIARVNRVYKDKEGGLVVDYIGIANDLKKALTVYTESGGKGKPTFDQEEAVNVMMEKYEIVTSMFHEAKGFDYKEFFNLDQKEKLAFPMKAADFILSLENGKERYLNNVTALSKAFGISVPHEQALAIRDEVGLFQAIKSRIVKVSKSQQNKTDEEIETAIKQIVSDTVVSDEVVDIFDEAGIKKPDLSILSDEFLNEVKEMDQKNVALELLKKLLDDEIKVRKQTNLVQSREFSQMLEDAVKRYQNNVISAAQMIDELIKMAKEMKEADQKGEELGLDFREHAFYSALEVNDSAVAVLGDETLREIARELLDVVRKNTTIDWANRESIKAGLRVMVKKVLRKHGYPPDKEAKAVRTVLDQAELMAGNLVEE